MSDLISRADAIDAVRIIADKMTEHGKVCMEQAVSILEALPSADAVHTVAVCKTHGRLVDAGYLERKYMEADYLDNDSAYDVIAEIDNAPTVQADRPHGEWYQIKDHKIMGEGYLWHCSICDYKVYQDSSKDYPTENYCPNCGAKMGGDDE